MRRRERVRVLPSFLRGLITMVVVMTVACAFYARRCDTSDRGGAGSTLSVRKSLDVCIVAPHVGSKSSGGLASFHPQLHPATVRHHRPQPILAVGGAPHPLRKTPLFPRRPGLVGMVVLRI